MNKQVVFVLMSIFSFSGFVIGQDKVVTNADLEKFRQKRLQAERQLRENYKEMGFASPEEIAKQNEESRRELNEFAARLRQDQIEREDRQNDVIYYEDSYTPNYSNRNSGFIDYGSYYGTSYYNNYRNRRYRTRGNRRFKPSRDFRQRFINGLPNYVLRNHRFNRFNNRKTQRPTRRVRNSPRAKRN